jgi:hypothetical protein
MAEGSYYDKNAADYAVSFIEALRHTKGAWAGKPYTKNPIFYSKKTGSSKIK